MYYWSMTIDVDYENPWLYKGTNFTSDDIDDFFGFVYCITNNKTGREYMNIRDNIYLLFG